MGIDLIGCARQPIEGCGFSGFHLLVSEYLSGHFKEEKDEIHEPCQPF